MITNVEMYLPYQELKEIFDMYNINIDKVSKEYLNNIFKRIEKENPLIKVVNLIV